MRKRICAALLACLLVCALTPALAAEETPAPLMPSGLCAGADGTVVVADLYHRALWQRGADGSLTLLAGGKGAPDVHGQPMGGYVDGKAAEARFRTPWAVAPYRDGWAVTDAENNAVRYLADGRVYTLAGGSDEGSTDGPGAKARFSFPTGLCAGPDGSLFVADTGNSTIRRIDADGNVTTWAGGSAGCADGALAQARFREPTGLCWADGALYVADTGNHRICKIEQSTVSTLAGSLTGEAGETDGPAAAARFSFPQGLAVSGGTVYVADTSNGALRKIAGGSVTTLAAAGSLGDGLWPVSPRALLTTGDKLLMGDIFARVLLALEPDTMAKPAPVFSDVPAGAWYAGAVTQAAQSGLMTGTGGAYFSPGGEMSRAMVWTALARLDGQDVSGGDNWYDLATRWAVGQGITDGASPQAPVTREQLITMIYRYLQTQGKGLTGSYMINMSQYTDLDQVSNWAMESFVWAKINRVMEGTSATTLAPQATATRAEVAAVLVRFAAVLAD